MATYITRTATANNNSVGKWTFSAWVKRNKISHESNIIAFFSTNNYRSAIRFDSNDQLRFYEVWNGAAIVSKATTRVFRDTNAWYHIVLSVDKTVSSPSTQIYINGVATTSWSANDDYSQNESGKFNDAEPININAEQSGTGIGECLMSHVHFVDGTAYTASTFGETDSTTGEWKIIAEPSGITYGTNGFFILKDGNSLTDQSGNSNNFTVATGNLTNTEDCPSNVFATMNPHYRDSGITLSNGNLTSVGGSAGTTVCSTIAVNSGKWYWEAKCNTASPNDYFNVGVIKTQTRIDNLSYPADSGSSGYVLAKDGYIYYNGSQSLNTGTTVSPGDIVGFILDMDAGTLKLKKNGSDVYSGNAVVSSLNTGDHWYVTHGANPSNVDFNFGNGYFGTTAISSEGTNASGIGKFEYDVPANHTAICTKGLNE